MGSSSNLGMVDFAIGWNAQVRAAQVSPSEPIAKRPRIVRPNSDDDSQMVLSQGMEAVQLQAGDGSPKPPRVDFTRISRPSGDDSEV